MAPTVKASALQDCDGLTGVTIELDMALELAGRSRVINCTMQGLHVQTYLAEPSAADRERGIGVGFKVALLAPNGHNPLDPVRRVHDVEIRGCSFRVAT